MVCGLAGRLAELPVERAGIDQVHDYHRAPSTTPAPQARMPAPRRGRGTRATTATTTSGREDCVELRREGTSERNAADPELGSGGPDSRPAGRLPSTGIRSRRERPALRPHRPRRRRHRRDGAARRGALRGARDARHAGGDPRPRDRAARGRAGSRDRARGRHGPGARVRRDRPGAGRGGARARRGRLGRPRPARQRRGDRRAARRAGRRRSARSRTCRSSRSSGSST